MSSAQKRGFKGVKNHLREFYVYHYERWVLFKGWQSDNPQYSNEQCEGEVYMSQSAPKGWEWVSNWEVDSERDAPCDSNGFQYSNDLVRDRKSVV